MGNLYVRFGTREKEAYESTASGRFAADPVEIKTKLKIAFQTDSNTVLLPDSIHQLGSAQEWIIDIINVIILRRQK